MSFLSLQDGVHKGNKIDFEQPSSTTNNTHASSLICLLCECMWCELSEYLYGPNIMEHK